MVIKKITKEKFERYLDKVGWRLKHVGCEYYQLINSKDEPTDLILFGDHIEAKGSMPEYSGIIHFGFRDSILRYYKDGHFVTLSQHNDNPSIFLSFYDKRN